MRAPTLTDGPVTLRGHRPEDVDAVLAQATDEASRRWTTVPVPYSRADAVDWIASRRAAWASDTDERTFVVEADGRYAGQVGLRPDGEGAADIGYGLAPWARGRGLMSAAVRLALSWAFAEAGLAVVHWRAHVGNWPSRRVAWACGFRIEGTVRGLEVQRGERRDAWIGSILPEDEMRPRHPWFEVPTLRCGDVALRRHTDDDALRIAEACAHPSTQQWLPALPSPYTLLDAAEYLAGREEQHARGAGVYWAVADTRDDRLLGAVGLSDVTTRSAEVGYWVHPDARGRGVATAATRLAVRHALMPEDVGGLGLERVALRAAEGNVTSQRVAQRAGFTLVGRDRAAERLRDGTARDFLRYDRLATDPPTPR